MSPEELQALKDRVAMLERKLAQFTYPDRYQFDRPFRHSGNKLGFFNVPMIAQPSFSGETNGMVNTPSGTVVQHTYSFFGGAITATNATGYTISDIVKNLKLVGLLKN